MRKRECLESSRSISGFADFQELLAFTFQYWNSLPEERRPKRMDEACRHRAKYQAPATPEHYWEVEFPTTQQCIDRGYGGVVLQNDNDDSIAARRPRRKRPLNLITNRKTTPTTDTEPDALDFDN